MAKSRSSRVRRKRKQRFKAQPLRTTITGEKLKRFQTKTPSLKLVEGVDIEFLGIEMLDPSELNLDRENYQRGELAKEVLDIAVKIENCRGYIPTIKVSERPDDSRWVVDGQARAYAVEIVGNGRKIRSEVWRILKGDPIEIERRWFQVENTSVPISETQNVKSYPGPARTVLLEWLLHNPRSMLRDRIGDTNGSKFSLLYVMKYLHVAHSGSTQVPNARVFMSRFDQALTENEDRILKFAMMGANLLTHVYEGPITVGAGNRLMFLSLQALGLASNRRWAHLPIATAWSQPDYDKLRWIQEYPWGRMSQIEGEKWRRVFNIKVENILSVWST